MKILVCLGNPGEKYTYTRHNIGFLMGEYLLKKYEHHPKGEKWKAISFDIIINHQKHLLVFPQTFMNLSGESVQAVHAFHKSSMTNLLVIYDDFDIPFETIRFREKGSPGTHNGMKSIRDCLGNTDFPRLRLGIGPLPPKWNVADFVLSRFTQDESSKLNAIFEEAENKLLEWLNK